MILALPTTLLFSVRTEILANVGLPFKKAELPFII